KTELPEDTEDPTVHEVNLSLFPVVLVTLAGVVPERTLRRIGRDLQRKLQAIPSVLHAKIASEREEMVEVIIDPALAENYGLDAAEIVNLVTRSNQLIAAGALDAGSGRFAVK